ncbi:hypothetical protein L195_g064366, partial [Trifolium pratense]
SPPSSNTAVLPRNTTGTLYIDRNSLYRSELSVSRRQISHSATPSCGGGDGGGGCDCEGQGRDGG